MSLEKEVDIGRVGPIVSREMKRLLGGASVKKLAH
jgi:hypothetical protein